MKKFLSLILAVMLCLSFGATAFAAEYAETGNESIDEIVQDKTDSIATDGQFGSQENGTVSPLTYTNTYFWKHKNVSKGTQTEGGWNLLYSGAPASADGEIDAISASVSYTHTFSGSFATGIKRTVELELGYSFGHSVRHSISRSSRALKKGEYVKGYYKKTYEVTEIDQTQYVIRRGWKNSQYFEQTYATGQTKTATAKKSILPKIKLEYYGGSRARSADKLIREEYYDFIDGEYVLVSEKEF